MSDEKIISLDKIKKYLPDNKIGKEKFECIQSVPPRFRDDAFICLEECEDFKTLNKAWEYFLDDIFDEMTLVEKVEYNFTTVMKFNIQKIALEIVQEIAYENEKEISNDTIEKECYILASSLKEDIRYEVEKELNRIGIEVI